MFEKSQNKIEKLKPVRVVVESNFIEDSHLSSLKFLAAFKQPISISFWDQYAKVGEENLHQLLQQYNISIEEDGKICPIEIPGVDLASENKQIAVDQLDKWKNRKKS
ncbi:MAG: hypothetical protein H7196_03410 [candidate division SR1 bacterium]|nr:hypothetical protein [candidate division SR1 bacterium]